MDEVVVKPLTVVQLIEKLKEANPEATTTIEGCDCDAQAYDIDVNETTWNGSPTVYLTRDRIEPQDLGNQ